MTETASALYGFFSGFGLPAYISGNIPDNVQMPYITYDLIEPEAMSTGLINASVWYRDTGVQAISAKVHEIKTAIGKGTSLPTESGAVYLFPEKNGSFGRIMNDPNRETKRALLSIIIMSNTD